MKLRDRNKAVEKVVGPVLRKDAGRPVNRRLRRRPDRNDETLPSGVELAEVSAEALPFPMDNLKCDLTDEAIKYLKANCSLIVSETFGDGCHALGRASRKKG